ncbi:MAG: hypothetical protein KGJ11_01635, partial [Candidatus Omnitrophica bacterium]|nr:hypothetical protein [Candidatus Omnitrophota bacterium]
MAYELLGSSSFNWSEEKICNIYCVRCNSCSKISMHLSFYELRYRGAGSYGSSFQEGIDIDSSIFYSVPTSFFVIDDRIPRLVRELITEAEGSLKMNFLTGASACTRKAIYELTILEKCEGQDYETKIKDLKKKYSQIDPELIDVLAHIQNMTSDKVHEQSWQQWDSQNLKLILETFKAV